MPVRAILFDLDGTFVDTERESAEAMARALARGLDIEITQADRDFIIGRSWVDIYANLQAQYSELSWSRDQLISRTAELRIEVFADQGMTVLPGAVAAVHRFADLGRALVTGSSRQEAAQVLEHLGIRDAFDAVFAAEDYEQSKPKPHGYLAAARALGVEPNTCVVVEDSNAGIASGIAAGARVVAVRAGNFHGQDQSAAHCVIDTLDELTRELVEGLLG